MIHFITGKPGDGKSLFGTRHILETLVETERFIVTNIPLVIPEALAYVSAEREKRQHREGLDDDEMTPFDIHERLLVLDDDEVAEFYRFRSGGLVLEHSPDYDLEEKERRLERKEFRARMKEIIGKIRESERYQVPVDFHIDEAHDFFDSREWASCGRGIIFYATKHRHLHDNVFFYTQQMDMVEKRLRNLCSETHVLRNQLRRCIGPIKMRPLFRVKSFYGTDTTRAGSAYAENTFRLDPSRVAACYKTCGALGVKVKPEEIKNRGKFPWWFLPVGGVAVVLGIAFCFVGLPYLGAAATKKAMGSVGQSTLDAAGVPLKMEPSRSQNQKVNAVVVEEARNVVGIGPGQSAPGSSSPLKNDVVIPELRVNGVLWSGDGKALVLLSDGRILMESDPSYGGVFRGFVVVDGKRVLFAKPIRLPKAVKPVPEMQVPPALGQQTVSAPDEDQVQGSWIRGADGVSRLRERPTLGNVLSGQASSAAVGVTAEIKSISQFRR